MTARSINCQFQGVHAKYAGVFVGRGGGGGGGLNM